MWVSSFDKKRIYVMYLCKIYFILSLNPITSHYVRKCGQAWIWTATWLVGRGIPLWGATFSLVVCFGLRARLICSPSAQRQSFDGLGKEQWLNFGTWGKIWHWKENLNWERNHLALNHCIWRSCTETKTNIDTLTKKMKHNYSISSI